MKLIVKGMPMRTLSRAGVVIVMSALAFCALADADKTCNRNKELVRYLVWDEGKQCPAKGSARIVMVKGAEEFNSYIDKCGTEGVLGYMVNPAFISVKNARLIGYRYRGVLSAATIVMQIAYAATIREQNGLGKMFVIYGTPLEEDLARSYVKRQKIANVSLLPGFDEDDLLASAREILSENRSVVVFGSNGTPFSPLLRQVLFEELYPRESIMIGGVDEHALDYGVMGGIYVNRSKADLVYDRAAKGCEEAVTDLKSAKVPSYMTTKANRDLGESIGIVIQ